MTYLEPCVLAGRHESVGVFGVIQEPMRQFPTLTLESFLIWCDSRNLDVHECRDGFVVEWDELDARDFLDKFEIEPGAWYKFLTRITYLPHKVARLYSNGWHIFQKGIL